MYNAKSFRIGKTLYEQKFNYEIQSSYTIDELYNIATRRKEFVLTEMEKKANQLWPKYFGNIPKPADRFELVRKMIDTLSFHHAQPEEFQSAIEAQLPRLFSFVKESNLLFIDPTKPLQVRKEPAYMSGVAGVFCKFAGTS